VDISLTSLLHMGWLGFAWQVADLGLARHKRRTFLSGAVGLRGTLPWMAPEVVKTPGAVDERADVFAFGVVMWELWTCKVGRALEMSRLASNSVDESLASTGCVRR